MNCQIYSSRHTRTFQYTLEKKFDSSLQFITFYLHLRKYSVMWRVGKNKKTNRRALDFQMVHRWRARLWGSINLLKLYENDRVERRTKYIVHGARNVKGKHFSPTSIWHFYVLSIAEESVENCVRTPYDTYYSHSHLPSLVLESIFKPWWTLTCSLSRT